MAHESKLHKHYIIAFVSTLVVSLGLFITSFFLPPTGQVDPSVFKAVAEILCWPALAFAAKTVEEHYRFKSKEKE